MSARARAAQTAHAERQQGNVLKNVGDWFPRRCRNDVSCSPNNDGGGHEDNGTEVTMTYSFPPSQARRPIRPDKTLPGNSYLAA